MWNTNRIQNNKVLTNLLINQFVDDETLNNMIDEEESISKLSCLLELLYERINRNLSEKRNFAVAKILENDCSFDIKKDTLYFALHIQADNGEFKNCLYLFNEELSTVHLNSDWEDNENLIKLFCIAAVIIEVNSQLKTDIYVYVDKLKLKTFLLKMCGLKLSKDVLIDKSSLFFKYFDFIMSNDFKFIDETIQYFLEQENLDFLCLLFEKKLRDLVRSGFFQTDDLWNFLRCHIMSDNNVKKKQAQYILWTTVEYLKRNDTLIPKSLQLQNLKDWDFFFILLEMSKEKQLHLVQPTLKLLPSITTLQLTWQICLYQELLKHSQLFVVYSVIEHILQLKFSYDQVHQELLHYILVALNKFEYSNFSKNLFKKLEVFFNELIEDCCFIFFEEFVKINWNPAAAWCVLTSASLILAKIPDQFIIEMLRSLKKLPHFYIKQSCIIFFIEELLNNSRNILEHFLMIGKFLLSTGQEIDKKIFYQFIDDKKVELEMYDKNLKEMVKKSIEDKNAEHLIINMELLKALNMEIDYKLGKPHSILDDIILLYFPNLLQPFDVATYLLQRLQNIYDDDYQYLLQFLEMSFDNALPNISSTECSNLWNLGLSSKNKRLIVSYLVYRLSEVDNFTIDSRLIKQAEIDLNNSTYDICKPWIKRFRKSFDKTQDNQQHSQLIKKFLELLDIDNDDALKIIVTNLDLATKYSTFEKPEHFKFLDICLRKLCTLPNNLMRTYCKLFFKSIFELNLFTQPTFVEYWRKWYIELFECYFMECETLIKVILEGCRKIISLEAPYANILTPFILSAVTKGCVIQKNQRVEYGICQEIQHKIGRKFIENPNIMAMDSKMLSIECLFLLAKNESSRNFSPADKLIELLLDLYMKNYKKRYFPDSKIHLEKLRIVQAMLMLVYFTDRTKEKLVQFILNSFCEESHQPSVKQLLQWLLIILVSRTSSFLSLIIEKVDTASLSHPSSVVALIPVVYHLVTSLKDEEYWFQITNALLPWTMGANFKLRAYSQVTLRNILRKAEQKQLIKYIERYSFIKSSISAVIDATGNAITETLKNDMTFIESFDPSLHYTVENIFVALPRMLNVPPSEWENVLHHNFSEKFDVEIENVYKLPSLMYHTNNEDKHSDEVLGVNVQKKIIPWKQHLEEKIEERSLNSLICVASLVEKSSNLGGLSRTCEIFNVKQLVLHNIKIRDDKEFKNLSMSSENWIDLMEVKKDDLSNFLITLKKQGFSLIGLEQTSESVKLHQFKFEKKSVILLGNEKEGIPAPLLPLLDTCVEITQFGQTRSLNVHVAGATCIWEYVKQHML